MPVLECHNKTIKNPLIIPLVIDDPDVKNKYYPFVS
jgi:hypothetical protein